MYSVRAVTIFTLTACFCVCMLFLQNLMSPTSLFSRFISPISAASSVAVERRPKVQRGRQSDDSRWYSQTSPFKLHVYSSFYDDRPSLGTPPPRVGTYSPRVVVNAIFDSSAAVSVTECLLWFDGRDREVDALLVPAVTTFSSKGAQLVVCYLPTNITEVPVDVALGWRNDTTIGRTRWRVVVEVVRRVTSPGELVVCLGAAYGSPDPSAVAEWFEMQRLVGVERVVVYNWSLSDNLDHVITDYSRDGFVELRQSRGDHLRDETVECHKVTSVNDCMYRYMGSYRYIAVMDLDEVIIPRYNFTTLPSLLRNMSAVSRPAMFVFRNAHFFLDLPADVDLLPVKDGVNYSTSTYLTHRRRATISPLFYVIKYIIDSDACIDAWIHVCVKFTDEFRLRHGLGKRLVSPDLALKHHYRKRCNFGEILYEPGACVSERKSPVVDNVLVKYADDLLSRLSNHRDRIKFMS